MEITSRAATRFKCRLPGPLGLAGVFGGGDLLPHNFLDNICRHAAMILLS